MQTIECKRVDLWDGGDRHNFGFRIAADVPDSVIKKNDPHCLITKEVITVFGSLEEVAENSVQKLRKSAWAKLSPQERQALNLQEPS
ncbi:hypothetical protein [Massilia sp. TN1-12]|uniref:hypothetical protein n=1 Tax=Massilia paldalensis TaxID=3377675 RepID=UPI0038505B01